MNRLYPRARAHYTFWASHASLRASDTKTRSDLSLQTHKHSLTTLYIHPKLYRFTKGRDITEPTVFTTKKHLARN